MLDPVGKAGAPYILHPLREMLACTTIDERIVAVLTTSSRTPASRWPTLSEEASRRTSWQRWPRSPRSRVRCMPTSCCARLQTRSGRQVKLADLRGQLGSLAHHVTHDPGPREDRKVPARNRCDQRARVMARRSSRKPAARGEIDVDAATLPTEEEDMAHLMKLAIVLTASTLTACAATYSPPTTPRQDATRNMEAPPR